MKMTGRLIEMDKNCAAMNMAIDEAILIAQNGQDKPTLRFYDWTKPAFSFGYFQDISSEVDVEACRSEGIELVKRMTGGGTVVHGWDLTYTLILPRKSGEYPVSETYKLIGKGLVRAFQKLNIPAECYNESSTTSTENICLTNPVENDVMCNGKKLAGVSVRRNRNGIMFQGYISLDIPPKHILKHVSKNPMAQQILSEKSSAINTNGRFITKKSLITAICETNEVGYTFKKDRLMFEEIAQAETLENTKYSTPAWNFQ